MICEIQQLLDSYLDWLRDRTSLRQLEQWVEITTPYLDRHNDYIQVYAARRDGGYVLTDDGYTITDLEQSGCRLNSAKRQELLRMTLNGFGVQLSKNALEVHATEDSFPLRKHNLVQAILAVNDLFYLAAPMVVSLFYEDVVQWLDLIEVRYTPKVKFTGKSGYDHLFDFVTQARAAAIAPPQPPLPLPASLLRERRPRLPESDWLPPLLCSESLPLARVDLRLTDPLPHGRAGYTGLRRNLLPRLALLKHLPDDGGASSAARTGWRW